MILRVWQARSIGSGVDRYRRYFEEQVVPELQRIAGFEGATLGQRQVADATELTVETRWSSLEAIRAFAGDDVEAAVVGPEAREVLVDYNERVTHYEIIAEASPVSATE